MVKKKKNKIDLNDKLNLNKNQIELVEMTNIITEIENSMASSVADYSWLTNEVTD